MESPESNSTLPMAVTQTSEYCGQLSDQDFVLLTARWLRSLTAQEDAMHRSRLLLVALLTLGFIVAASAFRSGSSSAASSSATSSATASTAGMLNAAAPMLSPRSGHTATLLPNGKVLIAGGMRRNQDFYKSAELYDPATGKFSANGRDEPEAALAILLCSCLREKFWLLEDG